MNDLVIKKVHFVGIKGVGMAALARVANDKGWIVTGSDVAESFITENSLKEVGISWTTDFKSEDLPVDTDLVVYTGAHSGHENPQVKIAREKGIKTANYGKALGIVFENKKVIAVSGTHGKTTTSAMLATILNEAGQDPSWIVGTGSIPSLGSNGHWGSGEYAVIEADEYFDEPGGKPKFLHLNPYGLIITSLDWDHPDVFPTPKLFVNAFHKLIKRVSPKGVLVVKGEEKELRRLTKAFEGKIRFVLKSRLWHNLKLSVLGEYNRINATFAATMAHELGIKQEKILSALQKFSGVERRLESRGEYYGWTLYDDYAHHPTEIKSALAALREAYPNAWICVAFQSHTFSRTQALLKEFGDSFSQADQVLVAPIFASAREQIPDQPIDLIKVIKKSNANTEPVNSPDELKSRIETEISTKSKKILVTMGAGDIYKWLPHE